MKKVIAGNILSTWNMFVEWMDEYMSNTEDSWDEEEGTQVFLVYDFHEQDRISWCKEAAKLSG